MEWFYTHPSLRYGGYVIFTLIVFIPLSYLLSNYEISKNFKKKIMILIFLVSSIFVTRNVDRIIYELKFYQANFKENMFYFTDKKHFRIDAKLIDLLFIYNNCNQTINKCADNDDFIIKNSYGKMILVKIRN